MLTRLLRSKKVPPLASWSEAKKSFYYSIAPEQKMVVYSAQPGDPMATIKKLPKWHPFRSELIRLLLRARGVFGFLDQGTQPMPTSGEGLTALVQELSHA